MQGGGGGNGGPEAFRGIEPREEAEARPLVTELLLLDVSLRPDTAAGLRRNIKVLPLSSGHSSGLGILQGCSWKEC